jgi:PqqD family protein of HPr-rel-A system
MRNPAGSRWRLVDPSGIRVRRFGDEALVFNPITWETHLLNGAAVRVLDGLLSGPRPEAELVAEVCEGDGLVEGPASMPDEIGRFLEELRSLGLAEPVGEDGDEGRRAG